MHHTKNLSHEPTKHHDGGFRAKIVPLSPKCGRTWRSRPPRCPIPRNNRGVDATYWWYTGGVASVFFTNRTAVGQAGRHRPTWSGRLWPSRCPGEYRGAQRKGGGSWRTTCSSGTRFRKLPLTSSGTSSWWDCKSKPVGSNGVEP